ncbi:MAG: arylsulfatase [Bryobacteraceae bacterium]
MRITLIHALRQSMDPIEDAFARLWPEAELRNVVDDSLSRDLVRMGRLDDAMMQRFVALGRYSVMAGTDGILFSCSAFGAAIDAVVKDLAPLPVRKPNEAMVKQAVRLGGRVAIVSSFLPTLDSMAGEFPNGTELVPVFVEGAMAALAAGDGAAHDRLVGEACRDVACDVIALTQFSIARAAGVVERVTGKRVLTTPDAAVVDLKGAPCR